MRFSSRMKYALLALVPSSPTVLLGVCRIPSDRYYDSFGFGKELFKMRMQAFCNHLRQVHTRRSQYLSRVSIPGLGTQECGASSYYGQGFGRFTPSVSAVTIWRGQWSDFDPSILLRGTILNRTYGTDKKLYISLFLPTIFGPIYYGPPK